MTRSKPGAVVASSEIEERVRAQYERYPYPLRTPEEDVRRVCGTFSSLESLRCLQHHGFGGRSMDRPLRILVAGGGTGDATVELGWQLQAAGHGGEVVHLDLSEASIAVARERVQRLGIRGVTWRQGSLLDATVEELGRFDYINCSGVLHHLPDPWAGARALRGLLVDDGVLGVMVYGPHGRHGLYPAQELLRRLVRGYSPGEQVAIARRVLGQLPRQHPLRANRIVGFADSLSDTEIVDRYLHPCDRAFSVPEALAWMGECGLRVTDFVPSIRYSAALLVADPWMLGEIARLPLFERYAAAELWSFHLDRHSFFAVRDDNPVQAMQPGPDVVAHVIDVPGLAASLREHHAWQWQIGQVPFKVPLSPTPLHLRILEALDERRPLGEVARRLQVSWDRFLDVFLDLYVPLQGAGYLTLSRP